MSISNVVTGSVEVEIKGRDAEKYISSALRKGIKIGHIKRVSNDTLKARLSYYDYIRFKKVADSCEIRTIKKSGACYQVSKTPLRIGIISAVVMMIIASVIMSSFLLDITVKGTETIPEHEILEYLYDNGIGKLTYRYAVDIENTENLLYNRFKEIDLVNVYFKGSRLMIDIVEGSPMPELEGKTATDLVSAYDGVVEEITVENGQAVVRKYQEVKKGDILVRGNYLKNETEFSVHSRGSIKARVNITKTAALDKDISTNIRTGRETLVKYLKIGGIWVKIDGDNPYKRFSCSRSKAVCVGENMPLFFELYDVTYYETQNVEYGGMLTAAEIDARERAYYKALQELPEGVLIDDVITKSYMDEKGARSVAVTLTAVIDISTEAEASKLPREDSIVNEPE